MSDTTDLVMERGEARFDMCGQKLPYGLYDTDQRISAGLVRRLRRYAERDLVDCGFEVSGWACEVSTMDGDRPPSERYYVVKFTHAKGGEIGVQGIMTQHGHPCLDHGVFCERGQS